MIEHDRKKGHKSQHIDECHQVLISSGFYKCNSKEGRRMVSKRLDRRAESEDAMAGAKEPTYPSFQGAKSARGD